MNFRLQCQEAEALGRDNRWYCSQFHGRQIDDGNLLWEYYVRSGGAEDFANRFVEAMGDRNRWFCSEFYRRPVREPEVLWDYYMNWDKRIFGDPKPGESDGGLSMAS